ncbi:hypothetical protein [Legionella fairfieldensis]|uniref:hypothetical protein n=1 Tax=Legionella fairfieldensis TaxID=45064 RepID=UPI00048CA1B4|nr:hypothetical protein [Legionella fairfieldensis]
MAPRIPDQSDLTSRDSFSTHERIKAANLFDESLESSKEELKSTTAFKDYYAKRITGLSGFSSLKRGDTSYAELFKADSEDNKTIKGELAKALEFTPLNQKRYNKLNSDLKSLGDRMKSGQSWPPGAVASYLADTKAKSEKVLQAQHAEEEKNIKNLFTQPQFVNALKTSLHLENDTQVDDIKNDMLNHLKKGQEERVQEFQKSINDDITQKKEEARKEFERVSYFAQAFLRKGVMQDEINRIAHEKNPLDEEVLTTNQQGISAHLKGIEVNDLKKLETIRGTEISKNGDSYSVKIDGPKMLFSWPWPLSALAEDAILKDLTSLAMTIKASGAKGITMNVHHSDPKKAEELARHSYEACIDAGFPPEAITIQVNGETKVSPKGKNQEAKNELFNNHPHRLQKLKKKAATIAEDAKAQVDENSASNKAGAAQIKKELKQGRTAANNPIPPSNAPKP